MVNCYGAAVSNDIAASDCAGVTDALVAIHNSSLQIVRLIVFISSDLL